MLISERLPGLRAARWIAALVFCFIAASAHTQVVPSATKQRHLLSVGGEYANVRAGYPYGSIQRLWEIGGFVDYGMVRAISIEGDIRHLPTNGFYQETQDKLSPKRQMVRARGIRVSDVAKLGQYGRPAR
jgi:hypothetical protein